MMRDMALIRALLLRIESDPEFDGTRQVSPAKFRDLWSTEYSYEEVAYHLNHLIDAGFVRGSRTQLMPLIYQLTWSGHEFLDDVRDPDVWQRLQEVAKSVKSISLGFLWEVAKAELRVKLDVP